MRALVSTGGSQYRGDQAVPAANAASAVDLVAVLCLLPMRNEMSKIAEKILLRFFLRSAAQC